jgi:hypothetical protein
VLNTIWTWPPDNFVWTFDDDKQITLDEDVGLLMGQNFRNINHV